MKVLPKQISAYTKWSVGLSYIFVVTVLISIILVKVLGILSFDDRWWDITVGLLTLSIIISFATGLIALVKNKERNWSLYLSLAISVSAILFLLLHSLFIND